MTRHTCVDISLCSRSHSFDVACEGNRLLYAAIGRFCTCPCKFCMCHHIWTKMCYPPFVWIMSILTSDHFSYVVLVQLLILVWVMSTADVTVYDCVDVLPITCLSYADAHSNTCVDVPMFCLSIRLLHVRVITHVSRCSCTLDRCMQMIRRQLKLEALAIAAPSCNFGRLGIYSPPVS